MRSLRNVRLAARAQTRPLTRPCDTRWNGAPAGWIIAATRLHHGRSTALSRVNVIKLVVSGSTDAPMRSKPFICNPSELILVVIDALCRDREGGFVLRCKRTYCHMLIDLCSAAKARAQHASTYSHRLPPFSPSPRRAAVVRKRGLEREGSSMVEIETKPVAKQNVQYAV